MKLFFKSYRAANRYLRRYFPQSQMIHRAAYRRSERDLPFDVLELEPLGARFGVITNDHTPNDYSVRLFALT